MKRLFQVCICLGASLLSATTAQADEAQAMPSRQTLLQQVTSLPSSQILTKVIRVEFPPGYKTPSHTHEGPGPRYVVKGHLQIVDAGKTQVFGPGDVFWETGEAMTVENVGGSDAEFVIFEMDPLAAK